jgi:hypothetical protein
MIQRHEKAQKRWCHLVAKKDPVEATKADGVISMEREEALGGATSCQSSQEEW